MKHVMIFGAGQAGQMIASWLPFGQILDGFIDNNTDLQGLTVSGVPVYDPRQVFEEGMTPDMIWLAIINREACADIKEELIRNGYTGEIHTVEEIRRLLDVRRASLRLLCAQVIERGVQGSTAELGVYQGDFAADINRLFPERSLYLFDTFEGFAEEDLKMEKTFGGRNARASAGDFSDTSIQLVLQKMTYPENVYICQGRFPESLEHGACHAVSGEVLNKTALNDECFAAVSLDTDLYKPTKAGLEFFYPRLSPGGFILLHDYNSAQYPGVHQAALEFCESKGCFCIPLMDLHGTAVLIKE